MPYVKWGARKAILNDLSPAATFIAYNYNTPVDVVEFEKKQSAFLMNVKKNVAGCMKHSTQLTGKCSMVRR